MALIWDPFPVNGNTMYKVLLKKVRSSGTGKSHRTVLPFDFECNTLNGEVLVSFGYFI